jgi:hypothetical protein
MTARAIARLLVAWLLITATTCVVVQRVFALEVDEAHPRAVVASVWREGRVAARAVVARVGEHAPSLDPAAAERGATLVYESVVADGPIVVWPEAAFSLSLVPGRDGLSVTVGGRTTYVTPDDLLAAQAYDHGLRLQKMQIAAGVDVPLALAAASERLGVSARDILEHGTFRRIRVVRTVAGAPPPRVITPEGLDDGTVRGGALALARYLARGVDEQGRFRYLVDATTNQTLPGYDWPRHAGATYFLTQVAASTVEPGLRLAALRAGARLRDHALVPCGEHRCIGEAGSEIAEVGSTALAVVAFVEIARTHLDDGYALLVPDLTAFLRAQQRADGELMHLYDRRAQRPVDVQLLYYTGEAALAFARAHALLGDARDLDAATRALERLDGPAWSFFGSRYYWGEEHWTCQAMDDLWDRLAPAPREKALAFCLGWQDYGRRLMYGPGETPYDADGTYGVGPVVTPHLTPAGSRAEAGLATLDAARRAGRAPEELAALEGQMRRSLATLLRHELPAGREYLFRDPSAVEGAMPASEVDWQLRIDYAQHAGSALVAMSRYLASHSPQKEDNK